MRRTGSELTPAVSYTTKDAERLEKDLIEYGTKKLGLSQESAQIYAANARRALLRWKKSA